MPYYVRITTETDGLISDPKPYPTLADALRVAGVPLKTGGATTAWIEDDDGKIFANTDDVKKYCGLKWFLDGWRGVHGGAYTCA